MTHVARRSLPAIIGGILLLAAGTGLIAAAQQQSDLPAEKRALEESARLHRLQAPTADKAADAVRHAALASAPDEWVPDAGMLGPVNAPFPGGVFSTTNAWAGWLDATTYVVVHAGGPSDDTTRGAVFIERISGANGRISGTAAAVRTIVHAPAAGGPLRIVGVRDGVVIVANPAGRELRFRPLAAAFE